LAKSEANGAEQPLVAGHSIVKRRPDASASARPETSTFKRLQRPPAQ
jgi:hypothetical protein